MPLRDFLKKKDKIAQSNAHAPEPDHDALAPPGFTFMRSDTHTQEIISPPSFHSERVSKKTSEAPSESRSTKLFTRSRSNSMKSTNSRDSEKSKGKSSPKRLSQLLHLGKKDNTSAVVPNDLPAISGDDNTPGGGGVEDQWELRATMLARQNERSRPGSPTADTPDFAFGNMSLGSGKGAPLTKQADDNIQEAIRLHEAGDLVTATQMFGRLADPKGENNALSQVLYGLALRHGWGCEPDHTQAVNYLSAAASNAAAIEDLALKAGMKKGGTAKGELVLAIFELANCFRHGWGVAVDKVAAKQYYETAANLGDTDAMNEVGWCYIEGFGCKKDKWAAAKYYRRAEKAGSKTLGNSWIWKEKYNAPKK
ncbi:hypothetical protein HYFRA_00001074 [Hymenoscyphus fraxineus]|uniref:HCP-like protein n=1 Tax=Hymenoscyphus fraxineus TaxID=746836 RepID=A0A9N9KRT3_9HELO|nr:hypothetical protein HYFRA_00001074 [Hymenoscyphus fraxineus]